MPLTAGTAAVTGAFGLGGSILGGITSGIGARRQYKFQSRLQNKAFQQNLQAWHMQNEYNTPSAQLQRLKDAGLNPALVYGQGASGAAGNAGSAPTYSPPSAPNVGQAFQQGFVDSANALSTVTGLLSQREDVKSKRIDNERKQVELLDYIGNASGVSRPALERAYRTEQLKLLSQRYMYEGAYGHDFRQSNIDLNNARIRNLDSLNRNIESQIGLRDYDKSLRELELKFYNSSRFFQYLSPFLRLIKSR